MVILNKLVVVVVVDMIYILICSGGQLRNEQYAQHLMSIICRGVRHCTVFPKNIFFFVFYVSKVIIKKWRRTQLDTLS